MSRFFIAAFLLDSIFAELAGLCEQASVYDLECLVRLWISHVCKPLGRAQDLLLRAQSYGPRQSGAKTQV